MMSSELRVVCRMPDCVFFTTKPGLAAGVCYCTHAEKSHHVADDSCPLYRKDWSKAEEKVAALRKRFHMVK